MNFLGRRICYDTGCYSGQGLGVVCYEKGTFFYQRIHILHIINMNEKASKTV